MNISQTKGNVIDPDITTLRHDPNRGPTQWDISEIYLGDKKKGLNVPNVGDLVYDIQGDIIRWKKVIHVDESTHIATLKALREDNQKEDLYNQFKGVGPGYQSETWRVFYDPRVTPHTMMIDVNLHHYGEDAIYMKIFKGTDISSTGKVISMYRDNSTSDYSENVPLYHVGTRFDDSDAIKRPQVFHTTEHLEIGEYVTAVAYTASGIVASINHLLVAHGSNVRSIDAATAYVLDIELISPFLSQTDDNLLEFPSNTPRESVATMGRVHYSDGTFRDVVIDGTRMDILGLDHYMSSKRGEADSIALTYILGDHELAWNTNTGQHRHITKMYRYRTSMVDGSYSSFISVIPRWGGAATGWQLSYQLYNLDRDVSIDITEFIEIGQNSDIFDGRKYGTIQHLVVAVELDKLGLGLARFRYTQSISIGLRGSPLNYDSPFTIQYHANQEDLSGEYAKIKLVPDPDDPQLQALQLNGWTQATTIEEFLMKTYLRDKPVYDEYTEAGPLTPNAFTVIYPDGEEETFDLTMQSITSFSTGTHRISDGDTITIEWLHKRLHTTLYLSMTAFFARKN